MTLKCLVKIILKKYVKLFEHSKSIIIRLEHKQTGSFKASNKILSMLRNLQAACALNQNLYNVLPLLCCLHLGPDPIGHSMGGMSVLPTPVLQKVP